MTVFDQSDLEKFVNLSRMALNLAGFNEDEIILKMILDSLSDESRGKLNEIGLKEGEFSLNDMEAVLRTDKKEISLEEEFSAPQAAHETVQIYLKRLKSLLPQLGDDLPTVDVFLETFVKGLHPNLKESVKATIFEQIKRISRRNLKEATEQLEEILKVIAISSKEKVLKPRNTCYRCKFRHNPLELEDVEEAMDDLTD